MTFEFWKQYFTPELFPPATLLVMVSVRQLECWTDEKVEQKVIRKRSLPWKLLVLSETACKWGHLKTPPQFVNCVCYRVCEA